MKKVQYRQGDVLIRRVARELPGDPKPRAIPREKGRIVLAHGEATGHAHAIKAPKASLFEVAGKIYLSVDGDTVALEHEEHATVEIPEGLYEITRQREYSPQAIRNVAD